MSKILITNWVSSFCTERPIDARLYYHPDSAYVLCDCGDFFATGRILDISEAVIIVDYADFIETPDRDDPDTDTEVEWTDRGYLNLRISYKRVNNIIKLIYNKRLYYNSM